MSDVSRDDDGGGGGGGRLSDVCASAAMLLPLLSLTPVSPSPTSASDVVHTVESTSKTNTRAESTDDAHASAR